MSNVYAQTSAAAHQSDFEDALVNFIQEWGQEHKDFTLADCLGLMEVVRYRLLHECIDLVENQDDQTDSEP